MKRRDFFKKGTKGAVGAGLLSTALSQDAQAAPQNKKMPRSWQQMGQEAKRSPERYQVKHADVVVLGGGLAGICAAVAAARNGAKTVLVQDRPVLGGNSSSEMRVHVHGVTRLHKGKPERETGIIEELLLHNRFMNPQESFPVWDHVLYDFVTREPGLELMLNTQAVEAKVKKNTIQAALCWQATTEITFEIRGQQFIDCSGDGLLAASAGAEYRTGREGKAEFGEQYAPDQPDGWQMGATLLLSAKDYGKPMPFVAPHFAIAYDPAKHNKRRKLANYQNGIWWVEVGSEDDIIADAEFNREKLMGHLYGVWDYIKNSGDFPEAENMALEWVGSLPGRRESRRFVGDYILTEGDLLEHRHFEDAVAYGGWSLDEHCWAGIENPQDPPSYFHHHFKKVYEIPYRSLYSINIKNLSFAGRNISQTHIALSSSRVMATCSLMGQATGTAAALCVQKGLNPRDIAQQHIAALQEQMMRDDAFIPHRPARDAADLAAQADHFTASSTLSGDVKLLVDGTSRDFEGKTHHWATDQLPARVELEWLKPQKLRKVLVKCDTNVHRNIMMLKESTVNDFHWNAVPEELLKSLDLEARIDGRWKKVGEIDQNQRRLIKFDFPEITATAVRLNVKSTYGAKVAKLFELRCYES